jgi:hypothetical protein
LKASTYASCEGHGIAKAEGKDESQLD